MLKPKTFWAHNSFIHSWEQFAHSHADQVHQDHQGGEGGDCQDCRYYLVEQQYEDRIRKSSFRSWMGGNCTNNSFRCYISHTKLNKSRYHYQIWTQKPCC